MRLRAAAVVINELGQVLLVTPHNPDRADFPMALPGGGVEPNEHPSAAAIRECVEETGIVAHLEISLGRLGSTYYYMCTARSRTPRPIDPEIAHANWVHPLTALSWLALSVPYGEESCETLRRALRAALHLK